MTGAYLNTGLGRVTPQSEPIPGSGQVPNSAGGYSFPVDDWDQLQRFLILGSEKGTYYIGERELTKKNAEATMRCIAADGLRVVNTIVDISQAGRAARNDPALFALAMAASIGNNDTRRYALAMLPKVARIGTHLFHFAAYVDQFRGWGRGLRNAIAAWYQAQEPLELAYQLTKYQSRDKWSNRDLLRLAHPKTTDATRNLLYRWAVKGESTFGPDAPGEVGLYMGAYLQLQKTVSTKEAADCIRAAKLPREVVPTELLTHKEVWQALLDAGMPITAFIRNLATMTRVGIFDQFFTNNLHLTRLRDPEALRKARVHPIAVLAALRTYAQGKGERGHNTWTPNTHVVDTLDAAFYLTFVNVEQIHKRVVIGLDVSGSMGNTMVAGLPYLSCHEAQAAMAMVLTQACPVSVIIAFDTDAHPVTLSPRQRLDDVVAKVKQVGGGGTDCAIPITLATEKKAPVDAFVIFTDSETWQGHIHPQQAIEQYRRATGIAAKLIVVAMASNNYTIAAPNDRLCMNVVGFDTATPGLIHDFIGS